MKEPNVYSFFDECYVYYGDYKKEIERLKEKVKEWQDIATRINEDNNKLNYIIKDAREYIEKRKEDNKSCSVCSVITDDILEILDKVGEE